MLTTMPLGGNMAFLNLLHTFHDRVGFSECLVASWLMHRGFCVVVYNTCGGILERLQ
jgi:hypothetical protein